MSGPRRGGEAAGVGGGLLSPSLGGLQFVTLTQVGLRNFQLDLLSAPVRQSLGADAKCQDERNLTA
jgi:hypothetical protein